MSERWTRLGLGLRRQLVRELGPLGLNDRTHLVGNSLDPFSIQLALTKLHVAALRRNIVETVFSPR
jgi:hypothetical protein